MLRGRLFDEIEPHNAIEHEVFEQLIHASWQLDRSRALEDCARFQLSTDQNNKQFRKDLTAFERSRNSLEQTQNAAIRELRRLTSTRILAVAIDCNTLLTTQTNARVPALLDLRQTLPRPAQRPVRRLHSTRRRHQTAPRKRSLTIFGTAHSQNPPNGDRLSAQASSHANFTILRKI